MPEQIVFFRSAAEWQKHCLSSCSQKAFWHILIWDKGKQAYEYNGRSYCGKHINAQRPENDGQDEIDLSEVSNG